MDRLSSSTTHTDSTSYCKLPQRNHTLIVIDLSVLFLIVIPAITLNSFTFLSGRFADQQNEETAEFYRKIHYGIWFIYLAILGSCSLYIGVQLTKILDSHIKKMKRDTFASNDNIRRFEGRIFKIKFTIQILTIMCGLLALMSLLYTFMRPKIHADKLGNLLFGLFWLLIYPIFCAIVTMAILLSSMTEPTSNIFISKVNTVRSQA